VYGAFTRYGRPFQSVTPFCSTIATKLNLKKLPIVKSYYQSLGN
jgi:hypothetical protein